LANGLHCKVVSAKGISPFVLLHIGSIGGERLDEDIHVELCDRRRGIDAFVSFMLGFSWDTVRRTSSASCDVGWDVGLSFTGAR
jgi:hypothetical protein